jgi:hypothetical protein
MSQRHSSKPGGRGPHERRRATAMAVSLRLCRLLTRNYSNHLDVMSALPDRSLEVSVQEFCQPIRC